MSYNESDEVAVRSRHANRRDHALRTGEPAGSRPVKDTRHLKSFPPELDDRSALPAVTRGSTAPAPAALPARPVVLVSMDWIRPGDPRFGLGTASIASALRGAGVEVRVVADAVNRPGFRADAFFAQVLGAIDAAGTDVLVGIGAFVWCEDEVQGLLNVLGDRAEIVLGGPQISYTAAGELEPLYPGATYFVRGHGEAAMIALATGSAENGAAGLHVARADDLAGRADYPLESLPSPHLDGTSPIGAFVRWETQRGCQFRCTFCQHRQPGARLRRSELGTGRMQAEIAAFREAGTQRIAVLDPIFNTNRSRAIALLEDMRCIGLAAELSLQCRFELTDTAFLDALEGLDVKLEFGLQTIHDDEARAVGRPNRMDRVADVIADLNDRRIPYEISLIYGLPLQTLERFRASVGWCLDRGVPRVRAWPLMLLRGTALYTERDRWGYVESDAGRIPIVVESHSFSREEHAEMARIAESLESADGAQRSVA
ncbi:MAG: radical SAM protein [Gammaproteobacteria bacterium]|nr:radical SAM protein [Gammaproteobacteria bacterium]